MAGGRDHFLVCVLCYAGQVVIATNVALNKPVTMSSRAPHWDRAARLAVDGNKNTDFYAGSCVATAEETDPWLRVDLGKNYLVTSVKLYLLSTDLFYVYIDQVESPQTGVMLVQRDNVTFSECLDLCRSDTSHDCKKFVRRNRATDYCWRVTTGRRWSKGDTYTENKGTSLGNLQIALQLEGQDETICYNEANSIKSDNASSYTCDQLLAGRYVKLKVTGLAKILSLCELEVYGDEIPTLLNGPISKSVTSRGFTVEWGTCENGDNSMYQVLHRKRGVSVWTGRNVTQKRAVFEDLPHNTQYHVRIMCYWRDKSSDSLRLIANLFNRINVSTLCTVPQKVNIIRTTPTLTGNKGLPKANIEVSWQHISGADSGCDNTASYSIKYGISGRNSLVSIQVPPAFSDEITYVIIGLQFDSSYSGFIVATNNENRWSQSITWTVKTKEGWSSKVRSLQHVAQSNSLYVTWQSPIHPRGTIKGYKVSYQLIQRGTCSAVDGHWSKATLVTSLYHELTGLDPYTEYRVKVVPVNGAGDGVEVTMDWRTAATTPSSPPSDVRFNDKTARSLTFQWTAVSCDKINGVLSYYGYTLQGLEYDNRTWTGTSNDVTWTVRDLVPYALYSFTVRAVNNAGSSALSDVIRVRTDEAACAGGPCQNGGKCVGFGEGSRCVCRAAYTGRSCEKLATLTCAGNRETKCAVLPISAVKVTTP